MLLFTIAITPSVFTQNIYNRPALSAGNLEVPHERTVGWKMHSLFADTIYMNWAAKTLTPESGKGNNPRILLARLLVKKNIDEVNKIILETIPWGVTGTSWTMNKHGDYDFTMVVYTTILYLFGKQPEILYPATVQYLVDILLIEEGGKFRYKAPNTMGTVDETENHLLMTEGSRYLKNRWKQENGNIDPLYDNIANGMEEKLFALLVQMESAGLYEYNSLPYTGYTITGLLNLEAFASEKIRKKAREVLDYMNWCYAIGSYQLKHYAPMRRRYDKVGFQALTTDYHSVFMKAWLSYLPSPASDHHIEGADVHAIIGSCMPYRPADKVVQLLTDKGQGYFVKIGHGNKTCPEIYSAGNNYLLSAGGSNRGKASDIVARPIMLFLNDTAENVAGTFHLSGPGTDFMKWNNTGVYHHFACAAGPVQVPANYYPAAAKNEWKLFVYKHDTLIAIYSSENCGVIAMIPGSNALQVLKEILDANPDSKRMETMFRFPGGSLIEYDLNAPHDRWVIKAVDGKPVDRDFDKWALLEKDQ